jgi:hypothetical protein
MRFLRRTQAESGVHDVRFTGKQEELCPIQICAHAYPPMKPRPRPLTVFSLFAVLLSVAAAQPQKISPSWRNIETGWVIPDESYADQPYIVKSDDGAWLCVITTAAGKEGDHSQHIVGTRSTDFGRTWSPLINIEPPGPPEASYVTALKVPSGRLYVFYNFNGDQLKEVKKVDGGTFSRVDTLGHFVFKYSDDHGKTWSAERYRIPIRETEVDRKNVYGGKVQFFWHVGRPLIHRGAAYVTLHKVGNFDKQFMTDSEGNFLRSDNLLTERDPRKIRWELLPDGDVGLRPPAGKIGEEQCIVALSDGSLFTTFRTDQDHPAHAYSRDDGHTWTPPAFMNYGPGGRLVKHARAANFAWRAANGNFLYWFHNHGGFTFGNQRNPAWVIGGREVDTPAGKVIAWSEPEVLLYADGLETRMSYPDFVEDNGRYFITETEKETARVHEIPAEFLAMLWNQHKAATLSKAGLVLNLSGQAIASGKVVECPKLPLLVTRKGLPTQAPRAVTEGGGFSLDFWVKLDSLDEGQRLLDARDPNGNGLSVYTTDRGTIQLSLRGPFGSKTLEDFGIAEASWDCDAGRLQTGRWHHVGIVVDGGPKIISFIIDGVFNDGGDRRQFGWARFPADLRAVPCSDKLTLGSRLRGEMKDLRIYNRALRTSEIIGNWRATGGK